MQPNTEVTSCLYPVEVMHHRLRPKSHCFVHRLFQFYIDLDELPALQVRFWWFGFNRRRFYSFYESDHFPLSDQPEWTSLALKERVLLYLSQQGYPLPAETKVHLLTHLRCLGYVFNPVSFYFLSSAAGEPLLALAEVGNTFGEQKLFVLPASKAQGKNCFRLKVDKLFYVSPFSPVEDGFDFRLRFPDERLCLAVHSFNTHSARVTIATTQTGKKTKLNHLNVFCFTVFYPLVTLRVIFLIHGHALLLWLKRLPFIIKEANPHLQQKTLCPFKLAQKTLHTIRS
jgi:uncharacterized protein